MRKQKNEAEGIPPLSRQDPSGVCQTWAKYVFVCGDDPRGCIKLTSKDESITRIYGVVTRALGTKPELTIFKGLSDYSRDLLLLT